jgi:MOSC domain-containing protein YiiM
VPGSFVLSVNVAEPRILVRRGRPVPTGIWKRPITGRVAIRGVNVEGDEQADRRVHGGPDKAVYAYAREDTDWWEAELGRELEQGVFGENLTLRGVQVSNAMVGERWRVGSALLEVSGPRTPCWKLGKRMGDPRFVKRFAAALRPGAYLRIIEPGEVEAGDAVDVVARPDHGVSVALVAETYLRDRSKAALLLEVEELDDSWRTWAARQLERGAA